MNFWTRLGLVTVVALLIAAVMCWLATCAADLMNQPSNVQLAVGLCIAFGLLFSTIALVPQILDAASAWVRAGRTLVRGVKTAVKQPSPDKLALVLCLGLLVLTGCIRAGPGHVAIKVNLAGDDRGVDEIPIETGIVWYNPITEDVFEYPTFVQTGSWSGDERVTFSSVEGMAISSEISMSYEIEREKIPAFYVKFREDDLNDFTHGFMHNVTRDAFNEVACKMTVESIYGAGKEALVLGVRERVNNELGEYGIKLVQLGFIGRPKFPDAVETSINLKISAMQDAQRTENEIAQAEAEAKKVTAKAGGEADANRLLTESISQELIQWRTLEITRAAIEKWDGRRPLVEGSSSGMLLQIPMPTAQQ